MRKLDFDQPITFITALETLSLTLAVVMIRLREHIEFDEGAAPPLQAMHFLSALLEDTQEEVERLITKMEGRR
ncbi:MAG: hypothetical protein ACKOBC_08215 [Hyphomicrobiales bacterium]